FSSAFIPVYPDKTKQLNKIILLKKAQNQYASQDTPTEKTPVLTYRFCIFRSGHRKLCSEVLISSKRVSAYC
ncbi:TPA: hypothetical protein ACHUXI_003720, partial [Shigella flexneri]